MVNNELTMDCNTKQPHRLIIQAVAPSSVDIHLQLSIQFHYLSTVINVAISKLQR